MPDPELKMACGQSADHVALSADGPPCRNVAVKGLPLSESWIGSMRRSDVRREWRERWRLPEATPIARELASELVTGEVRTASPFGEVDGRADLRGLQVDLLTATQDRMFQRVSVSGCWEGLDLSGAGLTGMNWSTFRLNDCALIDAQLDDLRCWGVEVSDCVAQRASLRNAQIGATANGHDRSTWTRVDFTGADLRHLQGDVALEGVDFSRARFGSTKLGWSDLDGVRFRGIVKGLSIGNFPDESQPSSWTVRDVDFSEADLRSVDLIAVDLGSPKVGIILPSDVTKHWVIDDWPAYLDRVAQGAPDDLRVDIDVWVDHARVRLGINQTLGFINLSEASEYAGEQFVRYLDAHR